MGVLVDMARWYVEKRNLDISNPNHWIVQLANEIKTKAGVDVGPETSLRVAAVYACVQVLSETIASLPLKVYERKKSGTKNPVKSHPAVDLIRQPNSFQTQYEFFETMVAHMNLRGNAYLGKNLDGAGIVKEMIPLNPANMEVEVEGTTIVYEYTDEDRKSKNKVGTGITTRYQPEDIWHARRLSLDGLIGMSPITQCREAVGLALAAESHGSAFFRDGARSPGIVKLPGRLKEDAQKRVSESLRNAATGENRFKLLVFEEGLDWQSIGVSNEDAQYLETRQFQVEEIARIYRVPAILIGHPDKSSTYASAEQFMLSFVVHTVRPWCTRLEQSFNRSIIPVKDQGRIFAEFSLEGMLRGDTASRFNAYATARQWGWFSVNDIRKLENLNPVEGGDIYLQPVNMVEAGTPPPEPGPAAPQNEKEPDDKKEPDDNADDTSA